MSSTSTDFTAPATLARHASLSGRMMLTLLRRIAEGRLEFTTPNGEVVAHQSAVPGPDARIVLNNWRMLRRLLFGGDVGFAESFMDGDWSSPDLPSVIEFASRNQTAFGKAIEASTPARLLNRLLHLRRANTRTGSRRNIEEHYDLGNDFYATWLDAGMTYSAALYSAPGQSLEQAQAAKLARITDLLNLSGGERVLEIGCGWGGLAEHLIRAAGCHVTGITLSPSQLSYARARLTPAELAERADLRLQDYRDTRGKFDRVVSIEMFEAVGMDYWATYFACVRDRLAAAGSAVLQVITIADAKFESYRSSPDFIQRHIFPGGMLPSTSGLRRCIADAGLVLRHEQLFGLSYAATLAEWRRRFHRAWPELSRLGFDDRFRRKWDYYLAYCEGGFRAGAIDVGLYTLAHGRS
jgi:cyclopropane-fatty-acyl-phospholipid synthase